MVCHARTLHKMHDASLPQPPNQNINIKIKRRCCNVMNVANAFVVISYDMCWREPSLQSKEEKWKMLNDHN